MHATARTRHTWRRRAGPPGHVRKATLGTQARWTPAPRFQDALCSCTGRVKGWWRLTSLRIPQRGLVGCSRPRCGRSGCHTPSGATAWGCRDCDPGRRPGRRSAARCRRPGCSATASAPVSGPVRPSAGRSVLVTTISTACGRRPAELGPCRHGAFGLVHGHAAHVRCAPVAIGQTRPASHTWLHLTHKMRKSPAYPPNTRPACKCSACLAALLIGHPCRVGAGRKKLVMTDRYQPGVGGSVSQGACMSRIHAVDRPHRAVWASARDMEP